MSCYNPLSMLSPSKLFNITMLNEYEWSPFKVDTYENTLLIPQKYIELLEYLSDENNIVEESIDWSRLPATEHNWQRVKNLLVTGYWLNIWYPSDDTVDRVPTPRTDFLPLCTRHLKLQFKRNKFIRLNSLSCKTRTKQPVTRLDNKLYEEMFATDRVRQSFHLSTITQQPLMFAVRDWVNMSQGNEWRCFIFNDQLRAICIHDPSISTIEDDDKTKSLITLRVELLWKQIKFHAPCCDCVMDIWLSDNNALNDFVIEFNSYGFWGNSDAGLFDWIKDGHILYNSNVNTKDVVVVVVRY